MTETVETVGFLENFINTLRQNSMTYLETAVRIVLILLLAKIAVFLAKKATSKIMHKRKNMSEGQIKRTDTLCTLIQSVIRYAVYFITVAIILGELGLGTAMSSILATAGIGGLAIGIGAQSLIKDVMTGLFILFENQYAVGDFVQLGTVTGTVESVAVRVTTIRGPRGELNIIPNGNITSVTNFSRGNYQAMVDVQIAYSGDIEYAKQLMLKEAESYATGNEDVVEPPKVLGVVALTDSLITLRLMLGVKPLKHWETERVLLQRIKTSFEKEGITGPYKQIVILNQQGGKDEQHD